MEIVDALVHVWDADRHDAPWDRTFAQYARAFLLYDYPVTIDRAVVAMDAVGVNAALITSFQIYPDIAYALNAVERHPDRFRVVAEIDLSHPRPHELVETYAQQTDLKAIRMSFLAGRPGEYYRRLANGELEGLFTGAMPAMLVVSGNVAAAHPLVERHPETTFIIEHLGIVQGPHRSTPAKPFEDLNDLLRLSDLPNANVKLSGVPTVSSEPYPFSDLWPYLRRVINAFGSERVLWGSDFSRTRPMHTYAEAVNYLRYAPQLTTHERENILGATVRRLLKWQRPEAPPHPVS